MRSRASTALLLAVGSALCAAAARPGGAPLTVDTRVVAADSADAPPSFARDVRPLLADHCVACHGPDEAAREAGLRLDRPGGAGADGWTSDLGGYAAVVPGDPEASELLARVSADGRARMPPLEHGDGLDADEVDVLRRWIAAGAPYDEHWAYAPFRAVTPPPVSDVARAEGWGDNPIDAFVRARLDAEGLTPQPEAEPRALLRRVGLDLTGLPPTPEELEAFLADDAPGAYERAVDRLLASEAYAEHWTRAWLDLARYADSHGFTIDGGRSMWPWRDWVLRSIDADEPYDRFTVRQLAGDLLPNASNADVVATGFHRNTQVNQEGGAKDEENRVNAVHDRVSTTAAVWLGTTAACAQCHDHKYDPFSAVDYYRLFAFFDSTEDGGVRAGPAAYVARTPAEERRVAAYEERVDATAAALAAAEDAAAGPWRTWQPARTKADNGPELVPELDGSYRAVGQNAVYTVYALEGAAPPEGVAALRVEALPEVGAAGHGPGRSNGGNFVLTGLAVEARATADAPWRPVALAGAWADHEQDTRASGGGRYPAADVLDDDDRSGWAIKPAFGEPHLLHVALAQPLPAGTAELRVALEQRFGDSHALARFRVRTLPAVAEAPDLRAPAVPEAWRAAFREVAGALGDRPDLPTSLVLRERPVPRESHVFVRGSYLDPGELVEPGLPAAFAHLAPTDALDPDGDGRLDRLDLARWLTHPANALAHRVTVNRWWQAFFGVGLVETENDFGLRGAAPSHPDLLEWLAQAFVRDGLSRKALHRRIVTSRTYRQAVPPEGELAAADPANRLLARQRRLRLPAEALRDAALVASGLYAPRFGGPPVQPPQPDGVFAFTQSRKEWVPDEGPDRYRRTLYTRRWRSSPHPFLTTFDAPAPTVTCTRRERSTSPLQALTLANDPMVQEYAAALGRRALEEAGAGDAPAAEDVDARALVVAFELALGRPPTADERAVLGRFLAEEVVRLRAADVRPEDVRARAFEGVGRVLLNLHEFVTRP